MDETTRQSMSRRYLHVAELRRLKNQFFASKKTVEGLYAGGHQSRQRGQSVEFTDYRPYMPGDEIFDVDWKIYGRSDRLFVKLFEHQSDMTVHLLIDASASMAYAGIDESTSVRRTSRRIMPMVPRRARHEHGLRSERGFLRKYDQACLLAAAIAFLTMKQQDSVAFGIAQNGLAQFHRSCNAFSHLDVVLHAMEQTTPQGRANLADALREMVSMTSRRGLLVLFSDLLEERNAIMQSLAAYSQRGGDVILFHVLHQDELHLPQLDRVRFEDSEDGRRVSLNLSDIRSAYQKRLGQFLDAWSTACHRQGIEYCLVSTATPYIQALEKHLFSRTSPM